MAAGKAEQCELDAVKEGWDDLLRTKENSLAGEDEHIDILAILSNVDPKLGQLLTGTVSHHDVCWDEGASVGFGHP